MRPPLKGINLLYGYACIFLIGDLKFFGFAQPTLLFWNQTPFLDFLKPIYGLLAFLQNFGCEGSGRKRV